MNMKVQERLGLARGLCHPSIVSAVGLSLLVFTALILLRGPLGALGDLGYAGVVLIGIVGGMVGALGGLTGYVLGTRTSRGVQTQPTYSRSLGFIRRWVGPSVFTFALIPGPFMIASLWAGAVHYPLWRFLLFVTAGKMIKLTGFAFVGYYSIPWLFRPLG